MYGRVRPHGIQGQDTEARRAAVPFEEGATVRRAVCGAVGDWKRAWAGGGYPPPPHLMKSSTTFGGQVPTLSTPME